MLRSFRPFQTVVSSMMRSQQSNVAAAANYNLVNKTSVRHMVCFYGLYHVNCLANLLVCLFVFWVCLWCTCVFVCLLVSCALKLLLKLLLTGLFKNWWMVRLFIVYRFGESAGFILASSIRFWALFLALKQSKINNTCKLLPFFVFIKAYVIMIFFRVYSCLGTLFIIFVLCFVLLCMFMTKAWHMTAWQTQTVNSPNFAADAAK